MKKILLVGTLLMVLDLNAHINEKILYAFEAKCMGCHNTHKRNKIAPPLVAVNQVYLRLNDNNMSLAEKQMKKFLTAPSKKGTLMKPAVKLFGVMPKLDLNITEIENFSEILVETEFEIPNWFNKHYKSHNLKKSQ